MIPKTLFDKIWDGHVVASLGDGFDLVHVDRHVIHDLGGRGFVRMNERGYPVRNPELTFATSDHTVSTAPVLAAGEKRENDFIGNLRGNAEKYGYHFFAPESADHGIVHVVTPELGLALPGMTFACGDSHSCTIGALGAVAWGIGQSELIHVLVTQTSVQRRPQTMRIRIEGKAGEWITPKDIVLHLIGKLGAAGGAGYAVEYAGSVIRGLSMEARLTICNMSVEFGARFGIIAPDDTTINYLAGRRYAPKDELWKRAIDTWDTLRSDGDAVFGRDVTLDIDEVKPQITWGISPEHVVSIDDTVPDPAAEPDALRREALKAAIEYSGLIPGARIEGTPIDWVFIGSCTNARISDLRLAASVVKGRKVASNVRAWVVPGSNAVKREAEAEGLDSLFRAAGFEWRNAGCSMCGGTGDSMRERVGPGQRCVSTSNRNFVGRQGPGSRTMLASPSMAAAAAIAGRVADVRKLAGGA